jgi:Spy/CpxP family protein refolding chaperone
MMTRNKTIALATAAILVLSFSGLALAQGPGGGRGPGARAGCDGDGPGFGPGPRIERLAARLDLSDEQKVAIEAIQAKNHEKNLALRKDMLRLQNELDGELLKDSPDAKSVKSLVGKIGELKTQAQQNRMETRLAVREQLTPEQRDKMLLMGKGQGFGQGRGHGRGHSGGPGFGKGACDGDGPHGRGQGRGFAGDCPKAND